MTVVEFENWVLKFRSPPISFIQNYENYTDAWMKIPLKTRLEILALSRP